MVLKRNTILSYYKLNILYYKYYPANTLGNYPSHVQSYIIIKVNRNFLFRTALRHEDNPAPVESHTHSIDIICICTWIIFD